MKRMLLLLILPIVILTLPMSARGDDTMSTQPAPAQTDQIPSADVAKDRGMESQVEVDVIVMRLVGKPMDVALMIVKPVKLAIQDHEADLICEI